MISSTSSSDRTGPSDAVTGAGQSASRLRARPDRISIDNAAFLSSELERQQEIRPEALARGREVLSNPDYPFSTAISKVAEQIVNSSDLSEDIS